MLVASADVCAQTDTTASEVERQLEKAFEETDSEVSGEVGEQLTQFLVDLAANPVNINSSGLDELLQVPGINLKIARAIIDYRIAKVFETKDELLRVPGIGEATYTKISPYLSIGEVRSKFRDRYLRREYWFANQKAEVFLRYQQNLQQREGYRRSDSAGGYLGSPAKYYQRIHYSTKHLSLNVTQEKDPGEPLDGISGFDYNSAHIAFTDNGKLKDFVIGDYSLSFGQGLVLWSGGVFGKGRDVTGTVAKNERGIKAYTSAQETDFFRGVAASYGDKLELSAFYSDRLRTASVLTGDTVRFPTSSGFHRTMNEISRKNNITQKLIGGRLRLETPFGLFGVTGYHNEFSNYIGRGPSISNLYDFEGSKNTVLGADYRALLGESFIFGEIGRSQNGGIGVVAGIETPVSNNTEMALLYRKYQKDFQSFLGNGFGEGSAEPQNEEGFYAGLNHELSSRIRLSGYFDQYRFAAPVFGTTQATGGFDMLGMMEFNFRSELSLYLLLRNEIKDEEFVITNERGVEEINLGKEKRSIFRMNFEYGLSGSARLRSRIELIRDREAGKNWETGFLIYQDLRIQPSDKLRIDGRISLFDTDSYSTRVYQFESDLLYVFSNTVLYDQGQRAYISLKYELTEFTDVWLKYGITVFENMNKLGSGLDEINGNMKNSIGFQVRIQV